MHLAEFISHTQPALLGCSPCSRAQKGPGHWPPPEPECAKPSPCLEQSQAHPHLAADASTLVLTSALFLLLLSTPTWAFLGDSSRSHLAGPADLFLNKLISVPEELSCPSPTLPELWSRLPCVCTLVCSGCPDKMPSTWEHKQQAFISHGSGACKPKMSVPACSGPGEGLTLGLQKATFSPCSRGLFSPHVHGERSLSSL